VSAAQHERYRNDLDTFKREVLGFTPLSTRREIAEAVRDHDGVAVRSCQRVRQDSDRVGVCAVVARGWSRLDRRDDGDE